MSKSRDEKPWEKDPWPDLGRKFLTTPEKAYRFLKNIRFVPIQKRPKSSSGMSDLFHDLLRDTGIPFSEIRKLPLAFTDAFGRWKYGTGDDLAFRDRMKKAMEALGA